MKVTPASKWAKANEDELVELPSGNVVRLWPGIKVFALVRDGVLTPEHLQLYVKAQMGALDSAIDDLDKVMELNDALVKALFVEPEVVTPADGVNGNLPTGAIRVEWLEDADMKFLLDRATGGVPDAAKFRDERGGPASGADGPDVRGDAKQPARPRAGKPRGVSGGQGARRPAAKRTGTAKR